MTARRRCPTAAAAWLAGLLLALAGCASRAPAPTAPTGGVPDAPVATPAAPLDAFQQQQQDRAERAEAQGRWAEAALAWEVLGLLRPDDGAVARRLAAARQQIGERVARHQAVAQAAQRRGDGQAAMREWLELLALDPSHLGAADALRQMERERSARSQVGRFARPLLPARRPAEPAPAPSPALAEAARSANSQREHATLLARQGDLDGAITLLRDSPQWRSQPAHRAMVVDLYVRKAEATKAAQPEVARKAVEAALAIDARHPAALALQVQLVRPSAAPPARTPSTRPISP
jgi:tetratricopeptide (TPR) repeat protein